MTWETPEFVEIDMSAEIGGYQGGSEPDPWPSYVEPEGEGDEPSVEA